LSVQNDEDFVYGAHRSTRSMDPAFRRIVLGAGGLSVAVILVALLWSGVHGTSFGPPPVVQPPPGPLRVAPANPGGLVVPEANVPIMSGDDSDAPPQLAPTQAAPDISQLNQAAGVGVAPPSPAAAPASPAAPNQGAGAQGGGVAAQAAGSTSTPAGIISIPARPTQVQLAATANEPGAEAEWHRLQQKMPDLLGGKTPDIVPAVVSGKNIWRLRVDGFPSADAARAFCAQLVAQGAACTVAAF
jgi:hypothetical protein